ncbi:tetratricopeptide repeat protein [Azonexus fungiphilus]|uniref:tetratricopeptide repeat protein n=1 Tax=Azonexus fungiphilus TaxID=146940 RepID=UPI00156BC89D|nr:tetratricopeptide repeat protein [Azonexus fungiphilus]NHC07519.1 tetratricopeptide repeat protein [Azonexus fungiphilus]
MSQFSFDVSLENFEAQVLQASLQVPVVVDFWAPWCAPCQTLKPMLEKLADEYKGRFLLAKVNSDENPELAGHFGVRSIPSVKVVFQGQLVDEFNGALPEGQVREFLERIALPAGADEQPALREQAAALVAEGKLEEALACLVEASQADPQDQAVQLDAIDVLMQLGRNDEAGQLLAGEYPNDPERATALRARLALAQGAADTAPLEAKLAAHPDDHATRLELARAYAAQSRFREALEAALEVVRRDRFFDEGAGRKTLLQFFDALTGEQYDDLVREFRRKLSATLN